MIEVENIVYSKQAYSGGICFVLDHCASGRVAVLGGKYGIISLVLPRDLTVLPPYVLEAHPLAGIREAMIELHELRGTRVKRMEAGSL